MALAGQVLRLDGRPLMDTRLAIGEHEARTDRTGRFLLLLPGVSAGRHELEIDGRTASRGIRKYGFFEYGLAITPGRTTVLPFTIWMPRLDTAHAVAIPSPTTRETVITTPLIPGLELHLSAGTTIRDEDGDLVREVLITPIPVDRPPFPLPRNSDIPLYVTIPGMEVTSRPPATTRRIKARGRGSGVQGSAFRVPGFMGSGFRVPNGEPLNAEPQNP